MNTFKMAAEQSMVFTCPISPAWMFLVTFSPTHTAFHGSLVTITEQLSNSIFPVPFLPDPRHNQCRLHTV